MKKILTLQRFNKLYSFRMQEGKKNILSRGIQTGETNHKRWGTRYHLDQKAKSRFIPIIIIYMPVLQLDSAVRFGIGTYELDSWQRGSMSIIFSIAGHWIRPRYL